MKVGSIVWTISAALCVAIAIMAKSFLVLAWAAFAAFCAVCEWVNDARKK